MTRMLASAAALAFLAGIGMSGSAVSADEIKDVITSDTEQTQVAANSPAAEPVLVLKRETETAAQAAPTYEPTSATAFGDDHFCNKQETAQSQRIITVDTN